MSEYTQSAAQVRGDYIQAQADVPPSPGELEELGAEFDRWLAAVKAEAWDEGHSKGTSEVVTLPDGRLQLQLTANPYSANPGQEK